MKRYFCDICGKEAALTKLSLPQIITEAETRKKKIKTIEVETCEACATAIAQHIKEVGHGIEE